MISLGDLFQGLEGFETAEATSVTAGAAFRIYAISTADIKEYPKPEKIWKDIFKLR